LVAVLFDPGDGVVDDETLAHESPGSRADGTGRFVPVGGEVVT
jgi:hypothetical protein